VTVKGSIPAAETMAAKDAKTTALNCILAEMKRCREYVLEVIAVEMLMR
jgi:hypothetical protein